MQIPEYDELTKPNMAEEEVGGGVFKNVHTVLVRNDAVTTAVLSTMYNNGESLLV